MVMVVLGNEHGFIPLPPLLEGASFNAEEVQYHPKFHAA